MIRVVASASPGKDAPRVEALGLRVVVGAAPNEARAFDAPLAPGAQRAGGLELDVAFVDQAVAGSVTLGVRNASEAALWLESVTLRLRFCGHGQRDLRFLRHGWQSWSLTDVVGLGTAGQAAFPSGAWLRGMHHCLGERSPERAGWYESETVSVVGGAAGAPTCLAGVLERGAAFGVVHLARASDGSVDETAVCIDVELRVEVPLAPGEQRALETIRVALGDDPSRLLESFAELWGRVGDARRAAPFQSGWCSWYHFFHAVTEADLLRNLDALAAARDRGELAVDVVQLDDGYQRALGDWLETNEKFPSGLAAVAERIRAAGFAAGLWTAPFAVSDESRVLQAHPDWVLRDGEHRLRGTLNPEWSESGWCSVLDPSHDDVAAHLEAQFRAIGEMGFDYLKLDFLYMPAMRAEARDPRLTRAGRLRRGLEAIRAGAGPERFLLGCGSPLGPAVGLVDGMRIGPDVAPSWDVAAPVVIPGLEPALPSTRSALRSIVNRAWMHRRLWLNDPDCLMARTTDTQLAPTEAHSLAVGIAATGGLVVFSDDLPELALAERAAVEQTLRAARAVDAAAPWGVARVHALLGDDALRIVTTAEGTRTTLAALNLGDVPVTRDVPLAALGLRDDSVAVTSPLADAPRAGARARLDGGRLKLSLAPRESAMLRLEHARDLMVFCDFDGTFSVRDVGSTLAQRHLGERRPALWARYESGELDAWTYAVELFDGFALPEPELDAFLETIELDPGAAALLDWTREHGAGLRILSDGFDYNLDRLQEMNDVAFEYTANHLSIVDGRWRIAPGARNAGCACGTGVCKRGWIEAHRARHPEHFCVHVGNGRVSDLCGAEAADLAFAKDTLAPALEASGCAHHPFETLNDVLAVLRRLI